VTVRPPFDYEVTWRWDYEEPSLGPHLRKTAVQADEAYAAMGELRRQLREEYSFTDHELVIISATPKEL
jgi:hypothetical protein